MGYESRFIVVNKTDSITNIDGTDYKWAERIATFEMSKIYEISDVIRSDYPKTDCFYYGDDGNTEVIKDMYGERLREIPIDDLIILLAKDMKNDDYRRLKPLMGFLLGINQSQWRNITVLHYGY